MASPRTLPYRSPSDLVLTMRKASEEVKFFKFARPLSYHKALCTAITALPAGCALRILSYADPPEWAKKEPGGSGSLPTEAAADPKAKSWSKN